MPYSPPAAPYVKAIAPYVGGKPIEELAREMGIAVADIVKLASNENPLGMPANARAAMLKAMDELGRYPDGNAFEVKSAIARKLDIPAEWLTLGNGSNDILELAARSFLQRGQSAVYAEFGFIVYNLAVQAVGARAIVVPAINHGHDLDAMAAAIADDTQLIFIANPNNPTGTFLSPVQIATFLAKVPQRVVVVLDEAYNEYLPAENASQAMTWVRQYPNLLVSRTLSKAYGLAGLRVGYAVAQPEITDILNRIRQPFNVNTLAQAAAVAAIQDDAFLAESKRINSAGYAQLTAAFDALSLQYVPSSANFVLVKIGTAAQCAAVNAGLLKAGVIVRPVVGYGLPEYLRVSIGLPQENARFIAVLKTLIA